MCSCEKSALIWGRGAMINRSLLKSKVIRITGSKKDKAGALTVMGGKRLTPFGATGQKGPPEK